MRILSVISTSPPAMGGHYYSMRAIAEAYQAGNSRGDTVDLCSIGTCPSPVVEGSPLRHHHIPAGRGSGRRTWKAFSDLLRSGGYDVLHGYDVVAHAYTRVAAARQRKILVLTRCGGPPPIYHPFAPVLILFSRENYDYFRARRKFSRTRLFHIPNRVGRPTPSAEPVERRALGLGPGPLILRIARIGSAYDAGTLALIRAVESLSGALPDLQLLLIGAVYDGEAHASLINAIDAANARLNRTAILLKTDDAYTLNASRFLPIADFVMGTGRGAMEAMALGKPVYIALMDGGIVLVDGATVEDLSAHNFSGRASAPSTALSGHTLGFTLPGLVADPSRHEAASAFSRSYFDAHLAVESSVERYRDLYADLGPCGRFPWTPDAWINRYFAMAKFHRTGTPGPC